MPWQRAGYCCRCGDCCKGTPFSTDDPNPLNSGDMLRTPPVMGYCPLFEWKEGEPYLGGFCAGHEPPNEHPYYLSGCNVWPTDPFDITEYKNCTYTFTWIE